MFDLYVSLEWDSLWLSPTKTRQTRNNARAVLPSLLDLSDTEHQRCRLMLWLLVQGLSESHLFCESALCIGLDLSDLLDFKHVTWVS